MSAVPYPKEGQKITFLEPFPRKEHDWVQSVVYYIRANISYESGKTINNILIRIKKKQQIKILEWLLKEDNKLTCATVKCMPDKTFMIIQRSTQKDFFDKVSYSKSELDMQESRRKQISKMFANISDDVHIEELKNLN